MRIRRPTIQVTRHRSVLYTRCKNRIYCLVYDFDCKWCCMWRGGRNGASGRVPLFGVVIESIPELLMRTCPTCFEIPQLDHLPWGFFYYPNTNVTHSQTRASHPCLEGDPGQLWHHVRFARNNSDGKSIYCDMRGHVSSINMSQIIPYAFDPSG